MRLTVTSAGYSRDTALPEAFRRIREAGFEGVDLPLYDYSESGGPLHSPDWMTWVKEVDRAAREAGLPVLQAHAQLGLFAPVDWAYQPPAEIFFRNIAACASLGCKDLILHPVFCREVVDRALHQAITEYNLRWLRALLPAARQAGVRLHIENTCDGRPQLYEAPFTTAAHMLSLLERLDDPCFTLCLDTGHAHIMGQDVPAMIRRLGKHLGSVHLHDNLGRITGDAHSDQHLWPGMGTLNFREVFATLRDTGYEGNINLEPGDFLARLPGGVRDASMRGGAGTARAWMLETGFFPSD